MTFASCVKVQGQLKESPAKGQTVELVADSITLHGHCDNTVRWFTGLFQASYLHSVDFVLFKGADKRTGRMGAGRICSLEKILLVSLHFSRFKTCIEG